MTEIYALYFCIAAIVFINIPRHETRLFQTGIFQGKPVNKVSTRFFKQEGRIVPRKGHVPKRDVLPDPLYSSKIVTKLINSVMLDGKKSTAQRIVYGAFTRIAAEKGAPALEIFEEALGNITPILEVKARRVGGSTYQVPMEIRPDRRQALAIRWLVQFARRRGEKTMEERLAKELLDALNNAGGAVKRKDEVHRMAEANRAFSHYKW